MHRALQIPELLLDIFQAGEYEKCDLLPLALVCSVWNAVAVAVLWEEPKATSLLKLLPLDAWRVVKSMPNSGSIFAGSKPIERFAIVRPLTASDWERVLKRSCYVRSLRWDADYDYDESNLDQSVYSRILASPPPATLFPALRDLTCAARNPKSAQVIQLFLAPSLGRFVMMFYPWRGVRVTDIAATLAALGRRCPHLRVLGFDSYNYQDIPWLDFTLLENAIVDLARASGGALTTLSINMPCSAVFLPSFARCSSLVDVSVENQTPEGLAIPTYPSDGFPALCSLALTGISIRSASALVKSWGRRAMEDISISTLSDVTSRTLLDFTQAVSDHCKPRALHLILIRASASLFGEIEVAEPFAVRHAHLAPLRAFSELEMLVIKASRGSRITDTEYADLARSWPHLNTINLTGMCERDTPAVATLKALLPFAQCRELTDISLELNAVAVPPHTTSPAQVVNDKVTSLSVGDAPIGVNSFAVALYLSKVYPKLDTVQYECNPELEDEGEPETVRRQERWSTVETIFRTARNLKVPVEELQTLSRNLKTSIEDMCAVYGDHKDEDEGDWDVY
ncbi:hypothetical protein BD626DRAFT_235399 [Schizophyllum amplum]|uniref:Uncharacterized protein n=1 Tax=Schizophyllum amplum TaxID=97359 RepID=A0A550CJ99_9AGAR|nr:hypothetical protein BD626DRAFT_235399 [Auriculariopsis ampla]